MSRNNSGFTLIELLTIIAIIGVLASIAISQFSRYRMRGFDANAKSDLRNVAVGEEAYFTDNDVYKSCINGGCSAALPGIRALSPGVTLQITATASGFVGSATHPNGSGVTCSWDSSSSGLTGCL